MLYNGVDSYLNVNKTEICKFNGNKNITWYNFCLGSIAKNFTKDEQGEISLNSTVVQYMIFQLTIVQLKKDMLNIH